MHQSMEDRSSSLLKSHASAPGKVILFGEHGVVYGTLAIAASVSDLRIHVDVTERQDELIVIDLPDLASQLQDISTTFSINQTKAMTALDDDQSMGGNHHQQQATPAAARADGGQEGAIAAAEVEQMSEDEERAEVEATNAPSGQCCSDEEGPRNPCPATAAFLSKLFIQYPESSRKAYMAILFLWASILGIKRNKGVTIRASASTLPIGAGLGSSAALAVATAAAVLRLKYMREGNELSSSSSSSSSSNDNNGHTTTSSSSSSKVKARPPPMEAAQLINSWAYAAETLLHGHPSGLDNTVSCFGSAVQFRRSSATPSSSSQSQQQETANNNNTTKKCEFSSVQNFPPLRVLLTNTCVPRETKALVAHVSQLKEKLPGPTIAIMDAMEAVSQEFLSLIQQQHHQCPSQQKGGNGEEEEGREGPMTATAPAAASRKEEDDEEKTSDKDRRRRSSGGHEGKEDIVLLTSELIEMAHALLNALGVGHTKLDVICRETHKCGYSSKLTGAGGGGCALTLLDEGNDDGNDEISRSTVKEMIEGLENRHGFKCYMTTLGGEGCLWHDDDDDDCA